MEIDKNALPTSCVRWRSGLRSFDLLSQILKILGRAERSGLPGLGTCACFSSLLLEKGKTSCSRKERETLKAQGVPKKPFGDGFSPVEASPTAASHPHPLTPIPNTEAGRASVRLRASPSAEPEKPLAASDYTRSPGGGCTGTGAPIAPTTPHRPRGRAKGAPPGWPVPALSVATRCLQALEPASRGAVAPCAGYLPLL